MPITNIEGSTQLEFGHGDIEVAPGYLKIDEAVGVVCFFQRETVSPVGSFIQYEPNKTVELGETPVRMIFEKVESIDVVIRALEEAKRMMIDRMPIQNTP